MVSFHGDGGKTTEGLHLLSKDLYDDGIGMTMSDGLKGRAEMINLFHLNQSPDAVDQEDPSVKMTDARAILHTAAVPRTIKAAFQNPSRASVLCEFE